MPQLTFMWLMTDHTTGSGVPDPVAQVADNDLAVGRVVDQISHSRFWKSTAIFVVEDDTQNGVDHVDGHRGPAFVISPYSAGGVDRPVLHAAQHGQDDRADPRDPSDEPGGHRGGADVRSVHRASGLRPV